MVTAALLSTIAITALAAPAPLQEFNSLAEVLDVLHAEPGRHMDVFDGRYTLLDGNNVTVAVATPKYNWAMTTAIDGGKCLMHAEALMNQALGKRMNEGAWEETCAHRYCQNPGIPGVCETYQYCHICASNKKCI